MIFTNKTIVVDLQVLGQLFGFALLIIGLVAFMGWGVGAFEYYPVEVLDLYPVILADGRTAIEMTCRDVPGFYMQLFGITEERVSKYYRLDGGTQWLFDDFSKVQVASSLTNLHRHWLRTHTPQKVD